MFHWPLTNVILWAQVTEGLAILLILLTVDPIIPSWMFQRQKMKSKKPTTFLQHHFNARPLDISATPKMENPAGSPINHLNNSTMVIRSGPAHQYFPPPQHQPHHPVASPFEFKNNRFPMPNASLFATLTAAAASAANKGGGNGMLSIIMLKLCIQ